jgi:predicted amidohydrolase
MYEVKIIQLAVVDGQSREERFQRVEEYLGRLEKEEKKPALIMLPEVWATGYFNFDRYKAESEPLLGETYSRLAPWAETLSCYILAGSIVEKVLPHYYNTTLLIGPGGSLAGAYRKIHLFGYQSEEGKILTPGNDIYVLKTVYGSWGFSTCYDLRFPEVYREMIETGVDTIFVVAAWPLARLEHWELFNRTRALENLANLVSCNCCGEVKGVKLAGNSMAVDPWGEVVAKAGSGEELVTVKIDPLKTKKIRADFPALADRRIFKSQSL